MTRLTLFILLLSTTLAANADTQYFLDGVFGQADQKNSVGGFDAITASDSSKGVRAGFYLNKMLGVEILHMDYGIAEDNFVDSFGDIIGNTLDTQMTGVGLQGVLPLGHTVKLTGRLGLAAWKLKFTESDSAFPGDLFTDRDEGVDAYVGVGLRFDVEDNFRIAIEYENMDFEAALGSANTDQSIHNVAVSLGVLF
jgi:opacity protein-like surface antigen